MKRRNLLALSMVGLLVCSLGAVAAKKGSHGDDGGSLRSFIRDEIGKVKSLLSDLDVSSEQREKIHDVLKEHRSEIAGVAKPIVEKRRALRDAVLAKTPDDDAIRAAANDLGKAIGNAAVLASKIKPEVGKVLTSEQKEKIEAFRKQNDKAVDEFIEKIAAASVRRPFMTAGALMIGRALKVGFRTLIVALLILLIAGIVIEWTKSRHESRIASQVVEKGGYILSPIRIPDDLDNLEKTQVEYENAPVVLVIADSRLVRWSHGYLGVRIQSAVFEPEAANEFASLLKESSSLLCITFDAPHGQLLSPARKIIRTFADAPPPQYVFDRYKFAKADINELSRITNLTYVFFVNCDIPFNIVEDLRQCKKLRFVEFAGCNFHGTDKEINKTLDSLRKSKIEISYKRVDARN